VIVVKVLVAVGVPGTIAAVLAAAVAAGQVARNLLVRE
jgi:hypothetical protein